MNLTESQLAAFAQIVSAAIAKSNNFNLADPVFREHLDKLMKQVRIVVMSDLYNEDD